MQYFKEGSGTFVLKSQILRYLLSPLWGLGDKDGVHSEVTEHTSTWEHAGT